MTEMYVCSCSHVSGYALPLFNLTCSRLIRTVDSFDRAAHVDVVVIVANGQVVEATIAFGERRQIEGEVCRATEAS